MARTTKVSYGRTVSMDNFGNNKSWFSIEAEINEGDDPRAVVEAMRDEADMWEESECLRRGIRDRRRSRRSDGEGE